MLLCRFIQELCIKGEKKWLLLNFQKPVFLVPWETLEYISIWGNEKLTYHTIIWFCEAIRHNSEIIEHINSLAASHCASQWTCGTRCLCHLVYVKSEMGAMSSKFPSKLYLCMYQSGGVIPLWRIKIAMTNLRIILRDEYQTVVKSPLASF